MNLVLLALFVLLNIADVVTSIRALKLGRREGNPVVRWLIERLGYAGLLVSKVPAIGAGIGLAMLSTPLLGLACAFYAVIVFNNATGRLW